MSPALISKSVDAFSAMCGRDEAFGSAMSPRWRIYLTQSRAAETLYFAAMPVISGDFSASPCAIGE